MADRNKRFVENAANTDATEVCKNDNHKRSSVLLYRSMNKKRFLKLKIKFVVISLYNKG